MRQTAEQQVQTLQQQLASLQARQTDRGIIVTVGDVLFDTGEATLQPGAVDEVVRLATFLRDNPGRAVRIEGHTDSTGSSATNMVLSQRRADAVADTLVSSGIPRSRVVADRLRPGLAGGEQRHGGRPAAEPTRRGGDRERSPLPARPRPGPLTDARVGASI